MNNRWNRGAALAVALAATVGACPFFVAAGVTATDSSSRAEVTRAQFEKRQQKRFFKADQDANGLVSKQEFSSARSAMEAGKLSKRFDRIDANHDGSIEGKELTTMLDRRFKRLDADANGALSAAERSARRNRAKAQDNG